MLYQKIELLTYPTREQLTKIFSLNEFDDLTDSLTSNLSEKLFDNINCVFMFQDETLKELSKYNICNQYSNLTINQLVKFVNSNKNNESVSMIAGAMCLELCEKIHEFSHLFDYKKQDFKSQFIDEVSQKLYDISQIAIKSKQEADRLCHLAFAENSKRLTTENVQNAEVNSSLVSLQTEIELQERLAHLAGLENNDKTPKGVRTSINMEISEDKRSKGFVGY